MPSCDWPTSVCTTNLWYRVHAVDTCSNTPKYADQLTLKQMHDQQITYLSSNQRRTHTVCFLCCFTVQKIKQHKSVRVLIVCHFFVVTVVTCQVTCVMVQRFHPPIFQETKPRPQKLANFTVRLTSALVQFHSTSGDLCGRHAEDRGVHHYRQNIQIVQSFCVLTVDFLTTICWAVLLQSQVVAQSPEVGTMYRKQTECRKLTRRLLLKHHNVNNTERIAFTMSDRWNWCSAALRRSLKYLWFTIVQMVYMYPTNSLGQVVRLF